MKDGITRVVNGELGLFLRVSVPPVSPNIEPGMSARGRSRMCEPAEPTANGLIDLPQRRVHAARWEQIGEGKLASSFAS